MRSRIIPNSPHVRRRQTRRLPDHRLLLQLHLHQVRLAEDDLKHVRRLQRREKGFQVTQNSERGGGGEGEEFSPPCVS